LEPVKYYDRVSALNVNDHQLPLRVVRFTTVATPALDDGPPGSFLTIASTPFPFHIVAQDWDGRSVDLTLPMKFVLGSVDVSTLPSISVPLNGQKVALAPSRGDTSHSTATLKVLKLDIGAKPGTFPGALPFIEKAEVAVPAIDQLLGSANAPHRMTVTLVKPDPVSGDVFATLPEPVALNLPTDTAGGVVTPRFSIDRLSRSLGPVPCPPRPAGIPPKVDGLGGLDPSQMLSAFTHTKLLGDITLEKVIAKVDDVAGAARQLPTLLQRHLPTAIETSFIWAPTLQPDVPAPLVLNHTSSLTIAAVTRVPVNGGTPTFTVDGKLTDFALDFPGILRVSFSELTFHGGKGQKVSVTPKVAAVNFQGPLEFLTELADIIPKGDNSAGANVRVTAQGITAGFTLLIPAAGVGIFSIEQLGFSIELSLPFDGPLALRLGFSERSHPFLVTVSLIGGGGFLAIAMNSGGMQLLEGSIDLGANLTVGLGIVEANVHVLGGFYFALRDNQLEFSAFLRIGGSVELLGIAGISIEIYLALTFQVGPPKTIAGVASVTVGVHLLMFSTSVSLSVEKHFDIPSIGPGAMSANTFKTVTFEDLISPAAWETYCRAYA
jgi:hypothetical protein